jgi:hypothetical protein
MLIYNPSQTELQKYSIRTGQYTEKSACTYLSLSLTHTNKQTQTQTQRNKLNNDCPTNFTKSSHLWFVAQRTLVGYWCFDTAYRSHLLWSRCRFFVEFFILPDGNNRLSQNDGNEQSHVTKQPRRTSARQKP